MPTDKDQPEEEALEGDVLTEEEIAAELATEAEETDEPVVNQRMAELLENPVVSLGDEEFTIGEPDIGITIRIVNVIGRLGVRGEKIAARVIKNPTGRAAIFGMLAGLDIADLYDLGSAVLQFESRSEGRKFLTDLGPKGLKLAPLIRAFFLNYAQSADLRESLANFTIVQDLLEMILSDAGV